MLAPPSPASLRTDHCRQKEAARKQHLRDAIYWEELSPADPDRSSRYEQTRTALDQSPTRPSDVLSAIRGHTLDQDLRRAWTLELSRESEHHVQAAQTQLEGGVGPLPGAGPHLSGVDVIFQHQQQQQQAASSSPPADPAALHLHRLCRTGAILAPRRLVQPTYII